MPKRITISLWRDNSNGPAYLEYSWVPEGKRHTVQLRAGQQEGSETDSIPDNLKPSHVQMYRLTNNETVSVDMWQVPPGPPHALPVESAKVDVFQMREEAVGVVRYTDGTSAAGATVLDNYPRPCPELPHARRKKTR
jgi:hypothetical protein